MDIPTSGTVRTSLDCTLDLHLVLRHSLHDFPSGSPDFIFKIFNRAKLMSLARRATRGPDLKAGLLPRCEARMGCSQPEKQLSVVSCQLKNNRQLATENRQWPMASRCSCLIRLFPRLRDARRVRMRTMVVRSRTQMFHRNRHPERVHYL